MEDLMGLSKEDLIRELDRARDSLEDVEEERMFTLGQTGVHLGAARLQSLQAAWVREESRLRQRIEEIQSLLKRSEVSA